MGDIEVGGKTTGQLVAEMRAARMGLFGIYKDRTLMEIPNFSPGTHPEKITVIGLTVADLGFDKSATINQIYERAKVLGLELCPADTGPNYLLKYKYQLIEKGKSIDIGMKPIENEGMQCISEVRYFNGLYEVPNSMDCHFLKLEADQKFATNSEFAFCLREGESRT